MAPAPRSAGRSGAGPGTWDVTGLLVLVTSGVLIFLLLDRDFEFVLEPDFQFRLIAGYAEAFTNLDFSRLPRPVPHPYLDGSNIAYGAFTAVVAKVSSFSPALARHLPSIYSHALLATELVNAVARIVAAWLFYRSLVLLGTGRFVGFALAMLLSVSPQLIPITFLRVDHLVLLPLVAVFHLSLLLTKQQARLAHGIGLGLAMAFLANIKLTGAIFGILPVLAAAALLLRQRDRETARQLTRFALGALNTFVVLSALFLARFLPLGLGGLGEHITASVGKVLPWVTVLGKSPVFYYNIDLFRGYGGFFLVLVAVSFLMVLFRAVARRHPPSVFLIAAVLVFSLLGIWAMKYPRGGYHLVPIYLALVGAAAAQVRAGLVTAGQRRQRVGTVGLCVLLVLPLVQVGAVYLEELEAVRYRAIGIDQTRRQARNWLVENRVLGSTVCLMPESGWASAPLAGLRVELHYGPFAFPFLDPEALARYPVPTAAQVAEACDLVVLNDFHLKEYERVFARSGLEELWGRWERLFEELAGAYGRQVFACERPVYHVSRIEIYDLRSDG